MDLKPLSVLVTGSSGFIGAHVVKCLHDAGHKVLALDYMPPKTPLPPGVEFFNCDIRENALPNKPFDAVVHLAAMAGVRPSLHDPLSYEFTNVIGTIRLLDHCRCMGTPHFVFASSSSVYGPDAPLPMEESATPHPCSPYALTKLHAEDWGHLHAQLHGLRFVALRFFSVWGPHQRPDLALENFRRKLEAGQPIVIHGDGSQRRDLTHVLDVSRAVELALHWGGPGSITLNVGTGKNHSVMEMLEAVSQWSNSRPVIIYKDANPADVPVTCADIKVISRHLGWTPEIAFSNESFMESISNLEHV